MVETLHPAAAYDIILGLDTEFVRNNGRDVLPDEDPGNRVLCYSGSILNPRTGQRGSFIKHVWGSSRRNRITLATFIGHALSTAEKAGYFDTPDGCIRQLRNDGKDAIRVGMAAHFSRADLCGFSDFAYIKKRFDGPRGTFATINKPSIFEVRLPGRGRRRRVSVTMFDTKLLAPAGYSSLKRLGDALEFPKLSVPEVVDETGELVPGISRMDLVRERHPDKFDEYARRDAEVSVAWLMKVGDYCKSIGLSQIPATLGAISVKFIKSGDTEILASVLGRKVTANGGLSKETVSELAACQTLFADAFFGGRNEAYRVGRFGPEDTGGRPIIDVDLSGAYTGSMALCRPIDWGNVEHTKDLALLATLSRMTCAAIDFEFPDSVVFPSLPVDGGCYGLIFPRSGSTTVTGPELVVALNQGAKINVRAGIVLNWLDEDGPRPFAAKSQAINRQRAAAKAAAGGKKGSALELVAKEVGNSGYGKTAQAVCSLKSKPDLRRHFNPRTGLREPMGPSGITAPHVAAYTSAIPRAVMSEMLANAPADAVVLSVTTDGLLSAMGLEEAKVVTGGPVCSLFKELRSYVDPNGSSEILEEKHVARVVLSVKTRGNFTCEPAEIAPGKMSEPLCARSGHRLEVQLDDKAAEVVEWLRIYREREYDTKQRGCVFASLHEQWDGNSDLVDIEREVRVNFDYDMKRRPINLRNGSDGLIKFETAPWASLEEFLEWREDFDAWRKGTFSVLKVAADWERFCAWRVTKRTRSAGQRTPWQQHLLTRFATGRILPLRGRGRGSKSVLNSSTFSQIATLLSDAGVPAVTRDIVQKAGIRQAAIADTSPPPMLSEDFLVIEYLRRMLPPEAVLAIAAEINEVHIDHSSILLSHAKDQFDSVLKDRADTPSIIEINLNAPNSLEGRLYLAHLNQPEIALPTTPETPSAGANEQTPEAASDTPAETDGTNGAAPTPALSRLTPPVNPRHNSPALTRAMDAIVPVIEARLRRMGVTSKHLRLGRAAAIADDEAEADLSMATLVHALAIREGLPAEFAIAMIAGMVSAAVSASSPQATTTRTTR